METLFKLAVTIIGVLALFFVYRKIRRKFPFKVNCWFCNQDTKVCFEEINGFVCPGCQQYNGFDKDGGYNKKIPEQQHELLNKQPAFKTATESNNSNGLCKFCNNNQQLKIYQLANFVPLNAENYDVEIEHFQKQLEKAYKLCTKCDSVLRKRIKQQNRWLLGLNISASKRNTSINLSAKDTKSKKLLLIRFLRYHIYYFTTLSVIGALVSYFKSFGFLNEIFDCKILESFFISNVETIQSISITVSACLLIYVKFLNRKFSRAVKPLCKLKSLNVSNVESEKSNSSDRFETSTVKNLPVKTPPQSVSLNNTFTLRKSVSPVFGEKAVFNDSLYHSQRLTASPTLSINFDNSHNSTFFDYSTFRGDSDFGLKNLKLSPLKPKPIISPPRFHRNPWTNRTWDVRSDQFSRSSSQSSGFASAFHEQPNNLSFNAFGSFTEWDNRSVFSANDCIFSRNVFSTRRDEEFDSRSFYDHRSSFN